MCVRVCMHVRERSEKRESVNVCERERECVCVCMYIYLCTLPSLLRTQRSLPLRVLLCEVRKHVIHEWCEKGSTHTYAHHAPITAASEVLIRIHRGKPNSNECLCEERGVCVCVCGVCVCADEIVWGETHVP